MIKKFKRPIHRDFDYYYVLENFQTFDNLINEIKNNGTKEIIVYPRRSNGSVTKSAGDSYEVVLVEELEQVSPPTQTKLEFDYSSKTLPTQTNSLSQMPQGLNMAGLMGADVSYRYMDYPKMEAKVKELETENKTLKKENEQLSRENFKLEIEIKSDDKKREGNQQLIGMLAPALSPVLEKLLAPKIGLSQPQSGHQQFDQTINSILNNVGVLLTRSEDFYIELDDLIKKYGKNN